MMTFSLQRCWWGRREGTEKPQLTGCWGIEKRCCPLLAESLHETVILEATKVPLCSEDTLRNPGWLTDESGKDPDRDSFIVLLGSRASRPSSELHCSFKTSNSLLSVLRFVSEIKDCLVLERGFLPLLQQCLHPLFLGSVMKRQIKPKGTCVAIIKLLVMNHLSLKSKVNLTFLTTQWSEIK